MSAPKRRYSRRIEYTSAPYEDLLRTARKGEQPAITDVMFCSVFGLRNRNRVITMTNEVLCQAHCTGERAVSMSRAAEQPKKRYFPPTFVKRSREQATLLLVGHAWIGDSAARDLLELLFPEQAEKKRDN